MKPLAIFIHAYNRPRHLSVAMEALSRCKGLSDWDVFLDLDGGGGEVECLAIPPRFPHFVVRRTRNLGCRKHPTELYRTALDFGYEHILYVEDDHLVRSDILEWVRSKIGFGGIISTYHREDCVETGVRWTADSPPLLSAALARDVVDFMDRKLDVGLPDVCNPGHPIPEISYYKDASWWQWCQVRQIETLFAPEQFSLNFGFSGVHRNNSEFDRIAFRGSSENWMQGVLAAARLPQYSGWGNTRTAGFEYQ